MAKKKPTEPAPAPIVGPQTKEEWFRSTMDAIRQDNPPASAREEYRRLLDEFPLIAQANGDLAVLCRRSAMERFESQPVIEGAIQHQTAALRKALGSEGATPAELLLIDVVLATRHDYYALAMVYEHKTSTSFTLSDLEKWERVLASKEARYLRAVETLVRVRRLLRLPAVQINIAEAGGQQVNVAGDLPGHGRG